MRSKIDVKKWQNLIFKVNYQRPKSFKSFLKKVFVEKYQFRSNFFVLCSIKIEQILFLKFLKKNWLFLTAIFGHLTRLMKKPMPFLWSGQSWLQSKMFFYQIPLTWWKIKKVVFISLCPKRTQIKTNLKNQEHQLRLQRPLSKKKPWPKKLLIFLQQAMKILLDCGFLVLIRSGVFWLDLVQLKI